MESFMLRNIEWRTIITHVHREANSCADYMVNLDHEYDSMTIVNFVFPLLACLSQLMLGVVPSPI